MQSGLITPAAEDEEIGFKTGRSQLQCPGLAIDEGGVTGQRDRSRVGVHLWRDVAGLHVVAAPFGGQVDRRRAGGRRMHGVGVDGDIAVVQVEQPTAANSVFRQTVLSWAGTVCLDSPPIPTVTTSTKVSPDTRTRGLRRSE